MAFASPQEQSREGDLTRRIEEQTSKVPSISYLGFALTSMGVSAALTFIMRKRELANFVGLWAPTVLILGVYNKLVKLEHEGMQGMQSRDYRPGSVEATGADIRDLAGAV